MAMIYRCLPVLFFLSMYTPVCAQHPSTVREYKKIFTTYPYSDPDPVTDFSKIYPYYRFDGYAARPVQQEWKVVELENDYLRLMILPEIGGKIWAAIEKSTGRSFIYYNHVVKFRDVAMRGPWTSGGIEANYGIIGHTPNSAAPVDYMVREKEDGSASCYIAWLDLLTRSTWCIEINLPKDKACFSTHSVWHNTTAIEQPYYHWMNVGIKTSGNLQFIYPGKTYIGHEGEHAGWPVNASNGHPIDFYEQNNFGSYKSYHVFGKYSHFFGAYWHDDDFGMARYAAHDQKAGKKIWIWGLSRQGMIWEHLLTDNDGQYAEIQSGRLFNQNAEGSTFTPFKHLSFEPYATDEWTEYWYPVLHTKGFVEANQWGALNAFWEKGWLKIRFSPVGTMDDELLIKQNGKITYRSRIQSKPLAVFVDSTRSVVEGIPFTVLIGNGKMNYDSDPHAGDLNRPVDAPEHFNWNSAYGNFVAGKEFMDQRLYASAKEKLQAALKQDANFLPALNKMAELYYHNMEYQQALVPARRALSIDTHDGASNYFYGLINEKLGNLTDAKDGFDIATLSAAYRAAAYTGLARIYTGEKDYDNAIHYADQALYYNAGNLTAAHIKSAALRKTGRRDAAMETLGGIEKTFPPDHFTAFEKYLWSENESDKTNFLSGIKNELPEQTFLELAAEYSNLGLKEDALRVLEMAPSQALVAYWKAYLYAQTGQAYGAAIAEGNKDKAELVLPFREEDLPVLAWVTRQTDDWKPKYYFALLYGSVNNMEKSLDLMNALGEKPDASFFYACRAGLQTDSIKKEADLLKAFNMDTEQWRYTKKLSEYHITRQNYAAALAASSAYYKKHPENYIIGLLYSKCLLLNGRYAEASKLLDAVNVIPFEGATEGRELYRLCLLMQSVEQIRNKKYSKALELIARSKRFPEHLGSGKPYEEDIDQRAEDYLSAFCLEQTGRKQEAAALLKRVAAYPSSTGGYRENLVVQAWALSMTGDKEAGRTFLNDKLSAEKDAGFSGWARSCYQGDEHDGTARPTGNRLLLTALSGLLQKK